MRFYPAMIFGLARAVNADPAFCMDMDAEGAVGYHDRMDPSYTIFHQESETFSSLWTAYTPDLAAFCREWEADMARFGTVPGPVGPCSGARAGDLQRFGGAVDQFYRLQPEPAKGLRLSAADLYLWEIPDGTWTDAAAPGGAGPSRGGGRISCGPTFFPPAIVGGQLRTGAAAGRGENINERANACAHRSHEC